MPPKQEVREPERVMSDTTFEVMVQRGDRWIIHSTFDVEKEAVAEAEKLVKTKISAVRVIRNWERGDGRHIEKVLLEKKVLARIRMMTFAFHLLRKRRYAKPITTFCRRKAARPSTGCCASISNRKS